MKSQCSFIPDKIWVREIKNGKTRVTLRRNFEEIAVKNMEVEKTQYIFDEVDIYIAERDNIETYVENNFDVIFDKFLLLENEPTPLTELELLQVENAELKERQIFLEDCLMEISEAIYA